MIRGRADRHLRRQSRLGGLHVLAAPDPDAEREREQQPAEDRVLGRIDDVERLSNELLGTPPRRPQTTGWVLIWTAAELRSHGYVEAGDRLAQQALRWWNQIPESKRDGEDFRRLYAIALYFAGRFDESHRVFSLLLEQKPDDTEAHVGLGVLAARRGDRAEAERMEHWLAEYGAPTPIDSPTMYRAFIAARLGDRDRAVELVRQALAQGRPHDIYLHVDPDLEVLRGYRPFERLMRSRD
jgi:tetratricopeptide (TPR) repeat protein